VKTYVLKQQYRKIFKHPYGILICSSNAFKSSYLLKSIGKAPFLVCVGDYVTLNAINASVIPSIALINGKTRRHDPIRYNVIISKFKKQYKIVNPPGTISEDAISTLKSIVKKKENQVLIIVDGEEDLLVLPLIILLPLNSLIVYGQPGAGAVVVIVNALLKKISLNLSLYFKPHIAYTKEVTV